VLTFYRVSCDDAAFGHIYHLENIGFIEVILAFKGILDRGYSYLYGNNLFLTIVKNKILNINQLFIFVTLP
jgi:hypothetical protein